MFIDSSDPAVRGGLSRPLPQRPDHENPKDRRCPLHLQRVCGTCAHYGGKLKPAAGEPDRATCAALKHEPHRRQRAWGCRFWTRKGGAA